MKIIVNLENALPEIFLDSLSVKMVKSLIAAHGMNGIYVMVCAIVLAKR
jgi:hypothetical protein